MVSRLLWDKGVSEFVEAARIARAQSPDLRFALIGAPDEGNPAAVPLSYLETWRDDGLIDWQGHRDDVPAVWRESHIAVLPSYREGLPKALLEAASSGRPIVAADVPGSREIARDGESALLVPPRDPAALAAAILRLAGDPALRAPPRHRRTGARGAPLLGGSHRGRNAGALAPAAGLGQDRAVSGLRLKQPLDRRRQLGEIVDHRVGPQIVRRDRAVPISRHDRGDARTLRGLHIGGAVADHDRAFRRGAEGRQRLANVAGIGLDPVNGVAGKHRPDVTVDVEVCEQTPRRAIPPVGADRERDTRLAQALDGGNHGGKRLNPLGLDLEVVGDEPLDQGPERRIVGPFRPLRVERREEEALGAFAGPLAEVPERDRGVPDIRQDPVERRDEIGRGVEEGPVEIEEDSVHMLAHRADGAGRGAC